MGMSVALKSLVRHHMKGSMAYMSMVTNMLAFVLQEAFMG